MYINGDLLLGITTLAFDVGLSGCESFSVFVGRINACFAWS